LLDAGLVAARRLHRVYQAGRRAIRHWHHEDRWLGRTNPDFGLPQRRADLCAERPRVDVLPRFRRQWRAFAFHRRYLRTQRATGADAGLRIRSGMVAAIIVRLAARPRPSLAVDWQIF